MKKSLLLLIPVLLTSFASLYGQQKNVYADGYFVKIGNQAPDFTIKEAGGKTYRLSDLKGKVVMLQFTASWCSVCRTEMPFIEKEIWLEKKSAGLVVLGIDRDVGFYEERCRTCGTCVLADTGGICPVTRCSKGVLNGPCGGTREDGSCELADGIHCAWHDIYDRLKGQGRLSQMLIVRPPMEWVDRGLRLMIQKGYEGRYASQRREEES